MSTREYNQRENATHQAHTRLRNFKTSTMSDEHVVLNKSLYGSEDLVQICNYMTSSNPDGS